MALTHAEHMILPCPTRALLIVCFASLPAIAQIEIVNTGASGAQVNLAGTYTQNFDTLANTGSNLTPWSDNSTLSGWYAYQSSTGGIASYRPNNSARLASFGGEGAADRALGSGLDSGSGDSVHLGVRFRNSSPVAISSVNISFDGEQWFQGGTHAGQFDTLAFSYQVFDGGTGGFSVTDGWVAVDALTFTSPIYGNPAGPLDGNLPANRVPDIASTINGVSIAPGQEIWFRWMATNQAAVSDHGLAIDNLTVTFGAIPEPGAFAAWLGASAALTAGLRRRRRSIG